MKGASLTAGDLQPIFGFSYLKLTPVPAAVAAGGL